MGRICTICAHGDRSEIEGAVAAREPHRSIERRFGVSREAIARHLKHAGNEIVPASAPPPKASSSKEKQPTCQSRAREPQEAHTAPAPQRSAPAIAPVEQFPELRPDRVGRVAAIEDMMLALVWERGKTGPKLAAHWGLAETTLEDYAAEAWRNIKRNLDPAAVKEKLAAALWHAIEDAKGDPKAVAAVAKAYAELAGLIAGASAPFYLAPGFDEFLGVLLAPLERDHPEALTAAMDAAKGHIAMLAAQKPAKPGLRLVQGGRA